MNNLSGSYSVPSTSAELEKLDSLTPLAFRCIADYDPSCIMLHRKPRAMRAQR